MGQNLYKKCKNLTILFVEDYLPLQKRVTSILNDYFKCVKTASNGKEGLKEYLAFKERTGSNYDIVMTDYEMPKFNGIELIKAIKKIYDKQVFIVISAHQNPEKLIEFINLDITHFATKPFGTKNMFEILNKISDKFMPKDDNLLYISDTLVWHKNEKSLFNKDKQIYLAKYDLLLLEILLKHFNFNCNIEVILSHFYMHNEDIKQNNIRNMIARLRKKIPNILIENIYGLGYKLSAY